MRGCWWFKRHDVVAPYKDCRYYSSCSTTGMVRPHNGTEAPGSKKVGNVQKKSDLAGTGSMPPSDPALGCWHLLYGA